MAGYGFRVSMDGLESCRLLSNGIGCWYGYGYGRVTRGEMVEGFEFCLNLRCVAELERFSDTTRHTDRAGHTC